MDEDAKARLIFQQIENLCGWTNLPAGAREQSIRYIAVALAVVKKEVFMDIDNLLRQHENADPRTGLILIGEYLGKQ